MTSHGCEPRTVLSQASFEGDLAAVTRLLGSGTDYLEVDASGTTSLHWAVSQQHLVIVEALLTHRQQAVSSSSMPSIQIHTLTFNELRRIRPIVTPIELAAHVNNEAIFKLLLKTLEPLVCALTTIQGFNSVWPAAPFPFSPSRGREVVPIKERDLIKNESLPPRQGDGNEVDWWDMFTSFILQLAIKDGKLAVVDMVLRLGANANKGYGPGKFKPLQVAAWCQKDPAFIRLLLKYGADPDAHTNQPPGSPLHIAIQIFNEGAITALLEAGASPNIRFWHITLLGLTCSLFPHNPAFCLRTVRVLLKAGADVNLDPHLMREAARIGNAPLFKELVAWGADITTKREHGSNVVTCMAARRNWGTAQDYHDILDLFHAKYKSRSDLREALLLERYIPFSLLLDFGLNADYPSHVGGFGRGSDFENYVYRLIQKLEPDKLEAVMESVHVLGRPEIRSGWSMAFTKDLADKSQITAEDVAEVLAIVRSLEYLVPAEVPSWEATLALHNVITEYDGPGDEIKGLVEAFLDLGAGLYAKPALAFTAFASRNKDYFLDMVAQSAIYAREEILSCLLRRIDSQADATETSFFARPSWFQQAAFDKARLSHNSNVNAILACLQYAGLPASFEEYLNPSSNLQEHPLGAAIERRNARACENLISLGFDVNWREASSKWTLLHLAIDVGCDTVVRVLLQANPSESEAKSNWKQKGDFIFDLFRTDLRVSTILPLHLAVFKGNPSLVKSLLEHGADVHKPTDNGPNKSCTKEAATALDFALFVLQDWNDLCEKASAPPALHPDRLTIATMLVERGAKLSKAIAGQLRKLTLDDILQKFAGHQSLWDTFSAGQLDRS